MYLTPAALAAALAVRDLSDPATTPPGEQPHAMSLLLDALVDAATARAAHAHRVVRMGPLVATVDNYDALGFDAAAVTRDRRYSHYVSPTVMLRSHTSAGIPALLRAIDGDTDRDEVLVLPGIVHRRDAIDRTHVGTPHQVDVWRVSAPGRLDENDLLDLVGALVEAVLPEARWRAVPAEHPYTVEGRQIDVWHAGEWLELAECGLIDPGLLARSGLDPARWSGLALGMGLDRALMLRKGIDDIRVLRSTDARIRSQMTDLSPWRPVSMMPPVRRDLSVVVAADDDDETLGDRVRSALDARVDDLESVAVIARTAADELPPAARERLGIVDGQVNALVRIVLRPLDRTLTDAEANALRDRVYLALHRGPRLELIGAG
jgi:phenylalanyl-tRNA synthetase alpha chain